MSAEATFDAMKAVIEAEGYPYLKHYRQDFYVYDRDYLMRTYSPTARYLWVVRESGTHLVNLGVHSKMSEEVEAVFSLTKNLDVFLVERGFVQRVSLDCAKQALRKFRYTVQDGVVNFEGRPLVRLSVQICAVAGPRLGRVSYSKIDTVTALTPADAIALVQIAQCEVVNASHSLFTAAETIQIDGKDLYNMVAANATTVLVAA